MVAVDMSNLFADAASAATMLAALAGSAVAVLYGRRASTSISATSQRLTNGKYLLSARPSVQDKEGFLASPEPVVDYRDAQPIVPRREANRS
jgi:hypothetical protein